MLLGIFLPSRFTWLLAFDSYWGRSSADYSMDGQKPTRQRNKPEFQRNQVPLLTGLAKRSSHKAILHPWKMHTFERGAFEVSLNFQGHLHSTQGVKILFTKDVIHKKKSIITWGSLRIKALKSYPSRNWLRNIFIHYAGPQESFVSWHKKSIVLSLQTNHPLLTT